MIVSIHIAKTAGTSFRFDLVDGLGPRVLLDYGDWPEVRTAAADEYHASRRAEMWARRDAVADEFEVIHGHFTADKYIDAFPKTDFIAFVRDPYQQAVSGYHEALRNPTADHPMIREVHEHRMSLLDTIAAIPNHQSLYLGSLGLDDLAMVGLTERYDESVAVFVALFGLPLPRTKRHENPNPAQAGRAYEITPDIRRAVDRHRGQDVELYRRACERFAALRMGDPKPS